MAAKIVGIATIEADLRMSKGQIRLLPVDSNYYAAARIAPDECTAFWSGGALCGNLIWLKEPNDPATGRPKTDKNNADASKQSRPLLGAPIVLGMKPSGSGQWSGDVYNASDGKTYSGSFALTGPNTADLKGCVLSFLCKTQTWTRAN